MTNADWWAKKLQQSPQQPAAQPGRPANLLPTPPSQTPMAQFPSFSTQPVSPKAQSAAQSTPCPDCGSANFMSVANTAPRCFDCGYPVEQSGSKFGSLAGAHVEGATKASIGNDATSNWNPQNIIGRVGS